MSEVLITPIFIALILQLGSVRFIYRGYSDSQWSFQTTFWTYPMRLEMNNPLRMFPAWKNLEKNGAFPIASNSYVWLPHSSMPTYGKVFVGMKPPCLIVRSTY